MRGLHLSEKRGKEGKVWEEREGRRERETDETKGEGKERERKRMRAVRIFNYFRPWNSWSV